MNKRILKIFNEAGFHQPEMERLGIEDKFEKFAELIVKETITEMCQQLYWHGEDQSNNPSFYKAIDKTKKQFGVEQ